MANHVVVADLVVQTFCDGPEMKINGKFNVFTMARNSKLYDAFNNEPDCVGAKRMSSHLISHYPQKAKISQVYLSQRFLRPIG